MFFTIVYMFYSCVQINKLMFNLVTGNSFFNSIIELKVVLLKCFN